MKKKLKSLEGLEEQGFVTQTEKELQEITGGKIEVTKGERGIKLMYGVKPPLVEM